VNDDDLRVNEPEPAYDAVIPAPVRYDKELPDGAKLLYAEIRALCKRRGYCWASNQHLANHNGVSPWTISIWLKKLAARNHVVLRVDQQAGNKRKIYLAEVVGSLGKTKEPLWEKPMTRPRGEEEKANAALAGQAEQIYSAYPRKAERPRAIGSIKSALKKVKFDFLLERTQAFARAVAGAEPRYIKHPATWFNNECWNDGEAEWARIKSADKKQAQMPYRVRENRINKLNEKKAYWMRQPESARRSRELEQIRVELHNL